jgi:hypothetical protein
MRILVVSALACLPFLDSAMAQTTRGAFGDSASVEVGGTPPPSPRSPPSVPNNSSPGHIVNSLQTVLPNVQSPGKIHTDGLTPLDTKGLPPPGQWTKSKP